MVFNELWHNGVNLCTIVQESHADLPIHPYPGYVFNPIPSVKGIRIQEGSLLFGILCLGCPVMGHLWHGCLSLRGPGSLLQHNPLSPVKMLVCSRCHYWWTISDKVIQAATVITMFLLLLSILHCSGKAYSEFPCHAFNAIWVFAVSTFLFVSVLFLQVCYPHSRDLSWLTAFKFP